MFGLQCGVPNLWGASPLCCSHSVTMLEKQKKVEEASLTRNRTRCRAASDEYRRFQVLGISGRGFHVVAKEYGIPSVWLRLFNRGEYLEGLDSTDIDDDSSDEESSMGILVLCKL